MLNNVIKRILFLIICIPSFIFCSDYSFPLRNSNTVALVTPQLVPNAHNYAHFSVGVNVNNDHASQSCDASIYKGLYPEIDALYGAGKKSELESLRSNLNSWKTAARGFVSMSALENRRKVDYIDYLMSGRNLTHLENLARIAAINSPRSMRRELNMLYDKTTDPVKRCHALIIADRNLGGGFITNRVSSVSFDASDGVFVSHDFYGEIISGNAPVDLMVTTELGSYAVERLLPPSGTQFTPELVVQFSKDLIEIVDKVPESQKKWLIRHACEGFLNRMLDVKGTVKSHMDIACRFAEEVNNGIVHRYIGDHIESQQQLFNAFGREMRSRVASCSREELAYATGERVADAVYFYMYCSGFEKALRVFNGAIEVYRIVPGSTAGTAATLEKICPSELSRRIADGLIKRGNCQLTNKTGRLENYACRVKDIKEAAKAFKDIEGFAQLRDISNKAKEGNMYLRMLDDNHKIVYRDYSRSFKGSDHEVPTIDIRFGDNLFKLRYADCEEAFKFIQDFTK